MAHAVTLMEMSFKNILKYKYINCQPSVLLLLFLSPLSQVTVQIRAIEGRALNMLDFALTSNQIVLGSGETSKLVPLVIVNDLIPEMSESFTVELLDQVTGTAKVGSPRSAVITILPSDDPNGVFGKFQIFFKRNLEYIHDF